MASEAQAGYGSPRHIDRTMKTLSKNSPECISGGLLFPLGALPLLLSIGLIDLICEQSPFTWTALAEIIGIGGLALTIAFYFWDEALWQIKGVELVMYDEHNLIVEQKGRLFRRKHQFNWKNIDCIKYSPRNTMWQLITYFSVAGMSQDNIVVIDNNGSHKVRCGVGLNKKQCEQLILSLNQLKLQYSV